MCKRKTRNGHNPLLKQKHTKKGADAYRKLNNENDSMKDFKFPFYPKNVAFIQRQHFWGIYENYKIS